MRKVIVIPNVDSERVGLYVRISEQDRQKLTKAQLSKSIENQIAMLKDEAKEREWIIQDIYCDEDISGADQTRPEFNRMLKDCESGKINIVLCKSQDRFARDMEIIEKYIHNKFIEWGVRFVTVVDHADTNIKENKKNRQITGLTSEWYLEDLSNNIKLTFNNKRKRGDYVASFAPYGYNKQRDLKNAIHLVIDPIASNVVKRIFDEYNNGESLRAIARNLNKERILCPSEYKWYNGDYINSPKKIYEGNNFISSGGYVIKTSFFNESVKIGEVVKQICKFDFNGLNIQKNSNIFLYKSNASDIYYTKNKILDDELLETTSKYKIWTKVMCGSVIPNDASYIYCVYKVKNKYEELYTSFELEIEKNRNKEAINFTTHSYINENKENVFQVDIRHKSIWRKATIEKIISNPVYIGTLVQGKTTTVSYKNHTMIKLPKEKWQIVSNAHDSIISLENWVKAQDRKQKNLRAGKCEYVNNFGGILKCSYCGKTFISTKCGRAGDKNQTDYYACSDRSTKLSNCINNKLLRKDELEQITLDEINKLIEIYQDDTLVNNSYNKLEEELNDFKSKYDALITEKEELLKNKKKNTNYLKNLFESKINGLIDEEEYFNFKKTYKQDNERIDERIKSIDDEMLVIRKKRCDIKKKDSIINKYHHIDKLNYDIVHEFISEIKIGIKKEDNTRNIEFLWNF